MPSVDIGQLVIIFAVLLFSLTVHESAHAWTAAKFGDPTAQRLGRISLNPAVHVDPVGTVLLPLVAFTTGAPIIGWAKPVPVDARNLARPRQDFLFIAAAGPASNLVLATMASVVMRMVPVSPVDFGIGPAVPVWTIAAMVFELNLLLAVFNMLPVPPLDGGNVLAGLLPAGLARAYDRVLRRWGFLVLYGLLLTGALSYLIAPPYLFLSWLLGP
ncbi:MAG: site-2 protease family protein [Vicinamibacterales bacterium]